MEAFDTGLHGARPRARDIGRLGDQTLSKLFFLLGFPQCPTLEVHNVTCHGKSGPG
jgi:hypothetical protein